MSKAIILGCSHAAGAEIHSTPGINIENPFEQTKFEAQNSYPVLLAKMLGYTPHNHAISGGSNDAMFRIFLEQLGNLTNQDIVIACWTGCNRSEILHNDHQYWIPLSPGNETMCQRIPNEFLLQGVTVEHPVVNESFYDNYRKQWLLLENHEVTSQINKIKNILALNAAAESKNIKVINIDSFMPVYNFQWPAYIRWPTTDNFFDWGVENNQPRTDWGHFYLQTHQLFAKILFEKITSARSSIGSEQVASTH